MYLAEVPPLLLMRTPLVFIFSFPFVLDVQFSIRMSLTRLSFLYPHLFKGAKAYECSLPRRPPRRGGKRTTKSTFSTSAQQREETYAQRYGTAAEPQPPPISASKDLEGTKTLATNIANEVKAPAPKQEERKPNCPPAKKTSDGTLNTKKTAETPSDSRLSSQDASSKGRKHGVYNSGFKEPIISSAARESLGKSLETILHTEDPAAVKQEEPKSPHLHARPYVHHFDTYTLVQDLQKGGFTEDQSVTLMKAVRSLLAINLEVARQELVAKSDVENVCRLPPFRSIPPYPPPKRYTRSTKPPNFWIHRKHTSFAPPAQNCARKF